VFGGQDAIKGGSRARWRSEGGDLVRQRFARGGVKGDDVADEAAGGDRVVAWWCEGEGGILLGRVKREGRVKRGGAIRVF